MTLILLDSFGIDHLLTSDMDLENAKDIARALLDIASPSVQLSLAIKACAIEVARAAGTAERAAVLMRMESPAVYLVSEFMQVHGAAYVTAITTAIGACFKRFPSVEIDPNRLAPGESPHTESLIKLLRSVLAIVYDSSSMPLFLCQLFSSLFDASELVLGQGTGLIAIGGLLFLRLLCPGLVTPPEGAGPFSPVELRARILLSKLLQALANNVSPSVKEPMFAPLDDVLEQERLGLQNFYASMRAQSAPMRDTGSHLPRADSRDHVAHPALLQASRSVDSTVNKRISSTADSRHGTHGASPLGTSNGHKESSTRENSTTPNHHSTNGTNTTQPSSTNGHHHHHHDAASSLSRHNSVCSDVSLIVRSRSFASSSERLRNALPAVLRPEPTSAYASLPMLSYHPCCKGCSVLRALMFADTGSDVDSSDSSSSVSSNNGSSQRTGDTSSNNNSNGNNNNNNNNNSNSNNNNNANRSSSNSSSVQRSPSQSQSSGSASVATIALPLASKDSKDAASSSKSGRLRLSGSGIQGHITKQAPSQPAQPQRSPRRDDVSPQPQRNADPNNSRGPTGPVGPFVTPTGLVLGGGHTGPSAVMSGVGNGSRLSGSGNGSGSGSGQLSASNSFDRTSSLSPVASVMSVAEAPSQQPFVELWNKKDVRAWAKPLRLHKYFKDIDGPTLLTLKTKAQLAQLGIDKLGHQIQVLDHLASLQVPVEPPSDRPHDWCTEEVCRWFLFEIARPSMDRNLMEPPAARNIVRSLVVSGITGEQLASLTDEDASRLGFELLGHRKSLFSAISQLE